MLSDKKNWYVMKTYPRKENVVFNDLSIKGYTAYLPKITINYFRNGKTISSKRPLISNYVFVNSSPKDLSQLNFVIGSRSLLCNNNKPVTVTEIEINQLKKLCAYYPLPQLIGNYCRGQKLRIKGGLLNGIEGEVISLGKRSKVVISCGLPGYSFEVDIDSNKIEILD